MINAITCLMLASPSIYGYGEINISVYKSTRLKPTIHT